MNTLGNLLEKFKQRKNKVAIPLALMGVLIVWLGYTMTTKPLQWKVVQNPYRIQDVNNPVVRQPSPWGMKYFEIPVVTQPSSTDPHSLFRSYNVASEIVNYRKLKGVNKRIYNSAQRKIEEAEEFRERGENYMATHSAMEAIKLMNIVINLTKGK